MDKILSFYNIRDNEFNFSHTLTDSPTDLMVETHIHDHYEIYFFLSGDASYYIEGQNYELKRHDLLIMNNKELHRPYFQSNKPYERMVIHFKSKFISHFNTDTYNLLHCFENKKLGLNNKLEASEVFDCGFHGLIKHIEGYAKQNSKESEVMIQTIFIQLLVSLNKGFALKPNTAVDGPVQKNKKISHILEYINENISEKLTLDMLQEKFYANKYYLCHVFKAATGFTIQEYVIYKRIMKAKELLASGMPVLETSNAVGFNDYSNFYRTFKKITGYSPRYFNK